MALALMLHDVFMEQVKKPVHAAVGKLVASVFGGSYDQRSALGLVKRAKKDDVVKLWTAPPLPSGAKPIDIAWDIISDDLIKMP